MRIRLIEAVGPGKPNRPDDVRAVQQLLDRQAARTGVLIPVTGTFDRATQRAIEAYERRVLRSNMPRGVVEPGSTLLQQLTMSDGQRRMAGAAGGLRLPPRVGDATFSDGDFAEAASSLHCEERAIRAVTRQEAPHGAFDEWGHPTLLFERHLFHRYTGGVHDRPAPDLSNPVRGGYGASKAQYGRLERAYALDATAALRATSWGAFQILADNYARCGFGTVDLFVTAMCQSAQQQMQAFVAFILFSHPLTKALQTKDWATFARIYNGPAYASNHYDTALEQKYEATKP